jgi:hypothetical protein
MFHSLSNYLLVKATINGTSPRGVLAISWAFTIRIEHLLAVLQLGQGEILAETACKGWEPRATVNPESDALMLAPNWRVACQEYKKVVPGDTISNPLTRMTSYPIKRILESGVSASNTCGRFRQQAKPQNAPPGSVSGRTEPIGRWRITWNLRGTTSPLPRTFSKIITRIVPCLAHTHLDEPVVAPTRDGR